MTGPLTGARVVELAGLGPGTVRGDAARRPRAPTSSASIALDAAGRRPDGVRHAPRPALASPST